MVKSYILKSCMLMSVNFRFVSFKHKLLAAVKLWMFKKITAASSTRQIQLFTGLVQESLLSYLKAQIVTMRFLAPMQPNCQPILKSWEHKKNRYTQQYQAVWPTQMTRFTAWIHWMKTSFCFASVEVTLRLKEYTSLRNGHKLGLQSYYNRSLHSQDSTKTSCMLAQWIKVGEFGRCSLCMLRPSNGTLAIVCCWGCYEPLRTSCRKQVVKYLETLNLGGNVLLDIVTVMIPCVRWVHYCLTFYTSTFSQHWR